MKSRSLLYPVLLSILPAAFIVLNLVELVTIMAGNSKYPFGSDLFSRYSIYSSLTMYITYLAVLTIFLSINIWLAFRRKWRLYVLFLLFCIVLIVYPVVFAMALR